MTFKCEIDTFAFKAIKDFGKYAYLHSCQVYKKIDTDQFAE